MLVIATFLKILNHIKFLSARILLVLAALLSSIKLQIPSTSYFKYIDLWFLWYTAFIFLITLFHIFLHEIPKTLERNKISVGGKVILVNSEEKKSKKDIINDKAKILFLIPFFIFNLIYCITQFLL